MQSERTLLEAAVQKKQALMKAAEKEACDALIGRRIHKMFEGLGEYEGTITKADPVGTCTVKYDDEDDEVMPIEEAETLLI